MSREGNLAKNTVILAIGTFLPKVAGLIVLPAVTAGLTKADYGTFDLITTLVALFLPVVTLQIHSAAFRFLIDCRGKKKETDEIISNIVGFITPTSLIALLILFFALHQFSLPVRILVCVYYFADIFLAAVQQIVRGLSYNKMYSTSSVIQSFTNMVLVLVFVTGFKQGMIGALLATTVATMAGVGYLMMKIGIFKSIHFSYINGKMIKEMLKYSWPIVPNSLSNWVLSTSDRLVLVTFMGTPASAVYAVANKIPALITSLQGTFVFAWQENATLASKDDDKGEYYTHMFSGILRSIAGGTALLVAATPILFKILIRGDYGDAYVHMPILFMAILCSCIASYMGGIYVAHKRTVNIGITTMVSAVINLVIDLVFVTRIGIFAASISTLVSYLFLMIYRMVDAKKFEEIHYNLLEIFSISGILIVMCVICFMNQFILNILNIVIGVIFAAVINRSILVSMLGKFKKKLGK